MCSLLVPLQDKVVAFQKFATMYIEYVLIFRRLEDCYDQVRTYAGIVVGLGTRLPRVAQLPNCHFIVSETL